MSLVVGEQGMWGCSRVVGRGSWRVAAEGRGCLQEAERRAAPVLPCLLLHELQFFGNLTGRGKLDLIISDKPLFPHPRELSQRRGGGRRMLGRVRALFVKDE